MDLKLCVQVWDLQKVAIAAITSPIAVVLGGLAALAIVIISVKTHFDTFKAGMSGAAPAFEKIRANFFSRLKMLYSHL